MPKSKASKTFVSETEEKRQQNSLMEAKKLKQKLSEIQTQNSPPFHFSETDVSDSDNNPKRKKKKKSHNTMELMKSKKKEKVLGKPKSLKSKTKKMGSDNSKKSGSTAKTRTRYTDLYDGVEAKFSVMERAESVLSHLDNNFPHFLKCMLPSNVAHGFWLHLPKKFCSLHFPDHDTSIILVDEWGNEYKTSYLLGRHGLSAGWRGFSISHRLLKGDILIFHLTEPCKLKVHIVRVNRSDIVNAALCLMNMDASRRGADYEDPTKKDDRKRRKPKYVEPYVLDISAPSLNDKQENALNSVSHSERFSSEVVEGPAITNQHQTNDLCYTGTSFLQDHPCEVLACR